GSLNVGMDSSASSAPAMEKRSTTRDSGQPISSKWWWSGDMRRMRRPVSLNEATWSITDSASATNTPPTSTSQNSRLMSTATTPSAPPSASEPVSPMNTYAGWQL